MRLAPCPVAYHRRMARDRSNTRFFVIMVIGLAVVIYVGLMFVSSGDKCGKGTKHWEWIPPTWVCGP
jgi:hypothetical protein